MTPPTPRLTTAPRIVLFGALTLLVIAACGTGDADESAGASADSLTGSADSADSAAATRAVGVLPRIGIAVADTGLAWCGAVLKDAASPALESGTEVRIVFAGRATVPSRSGRVLRRRGTQCPAAFNQPRWVDYSAYDIELIDDLPPGGAEMPTVALLVASDVPWVRAADGITRADLDGDGRPEEARRCTAGEGEHLTIWGTTADGTAIRRWHEYFDWGAFTEPTCRPGEDGVDAPPDSSAT